jgi:hypothetical protein
MAANRYAIKPSETTDRTMLVISSLDPAGSAQMRQWKRSSHLEPRQEARVKLAQDEEPEDGRQIDGIVHRLSRITA